ncbi:hypothetical protein HF888_16505 (plasmid) [Bermanella marisrubri]|uniref:hypothetical protein n=1 Tax=Bermanella marisrubri TaxID=207949 RepID=UPI001442A586|nr:hypothetical protein [Bermanella marisrubri]QIZ85941.1 hypothetical protein HF888_16505 [Bermanella marisrubri]
MSDANNLHMNMPSLSPTTALIFLAVCQLIDSVSEIVTEVIKSQDRKGSHVGASERPNCNEALQDAIGHLIHHPGSTAVLQQSSKGCELIITQNGSVKSKVSLNH